MQLALLFFTLTRCQGLYRTLRSACYSVMQFAALHDESQLGYSIC